MIITDQLPYNIIINQLSNYICNKNLTYEGQTKQMTNQKVYPFKYLLIQATTDQTYNCIFIQKVAIQDKQFLEYQFDSVTINNYQVELKYKSTSLKDNHVIVAHCHFMNLMDI